MIVDLSLNRFRFLLDPQAPIHMPAYNKGNVIRGGFGSAFRRIVCHSALPGRGDLRAAQCVSVHGGVSAVCAERVGEVYRNPIDKNKRTGWFSGSVRAMRRKERVKRKEKAGGLGEFLFGCVGWIG
jgi:hypothetical protein